MSTDQRLLVKAVLSGGKGHRLFPLSTNDKPKQYISFFGEKDHLLKKILNCNLSQNHTVIIASENDRNRIQNEMREGDLSHDVDVIYEPLRRDTSCAIYSACLFIQKKYGSNVDVLIVPSDNIIDEGTMQKCVEKSRKYTDNAMIVYGIAPRGNVASTLYGYIESSDEQLEDGVSLVKRFHEKPDKETAEKYVSSDAFYWNAGIFMSSVTYFLDLFKCYSVNSDTISDYSQCKSVAFDIDIAEKIPKLDTHRILVCKYESYWVDVGNFLSIYQATEVPLYSEGNIKSLNTDTSFLLNKTNLPMRVIGLKDVVVVLTDDGLLVSSMEQCHRIKEII